MKFGKLLAGAFLIFIIFGSWGTVQAEGASAEDNPTLKSEDLLLLEVHLDGLELRDEFLSGYQPDGIILLPMGQLAGFLELPLEVSPEDGIIEGFIWEEEKEYRLDVSSGMAQADGREFPVNRDRVVVSQDDIYLDTELLTEWLPLDVEVNPYSAVLRIKSARLLPLQEKAERRYRWERLGERRGISNQPVYPPVKNPYTLFSGPFIDQSFYLSYTGGGNSSIRHSTRLSGDLLYMSGLLYLSGPLADPFSDLSGRLGRRSPDADLLGSLNAHEFWLGYVSQPGVTDISSWESVKGVYLSSFPYIRPKNFSSHTFEGELPENWEVELYENGTLVNYQRANGEGKYAFKEIPLNYGINEFTLVFYDEYGQEYQESKIFQIDSSLIPPGEGYYRVDIGLDDSDRVRGLLRYGRGLNEKLSLMTDYVRLAGNNGSENFGRLSLRGSLDGVFWQSDYLQEFGGGRGGEIGLYTNYNDTHISLKHARFDNYNSEQISDLKNRTGLVLRRSFNLPGISTLGTRLDLTRQQSINDEVTTEIYNLLSTYYRGLSFRNDVNIRLKEDQTYGDGDLWVYKRLGDYQLRGELGYRIDPFEARTIAAELYGHLDKVHRLNLRINRDLVKGTNTYFAGITRNKDNYQIGLNASYTDRDERWKLGLSLSTSYGRDNSDNELKPGTSARYGAVSVKTSHDTGQREEPLKGVGYKINGKRHETRTDEDGIAFISDLRADCKTDIAIDPETLTDPFLVVEPEGVSFIPRAGQTFQLELSVVMSGELGGNVYQKSASGSSGLSGIEVQLLDKEGETVKCSTTAFDGYFYMSQIRPGEYWLKISQDAVERHGLIHPEAIEITIPSTGGYFDGFEFILAGEG